MRASLRAEYQIYDIRDERVLDLAGLVAWLPPGCALWRSVGGPLSWSEEAHLLNLMEYRLRGLLYQNSGSKGRKPDPPKPPEYAHEREVRDEAQNRKATAYLRRQSKVG